MNNGDGRNWLSLAAWTGAAFYFAIWVDTNVQTAREGCVCSGLIWQTLERFLYAIAAP
jgi:hypothetical protein